MMLLPTMLSQPQAFLHLLQAILSLHIVHLTMALTLLLQLTLLMSLAVLCMVPALYVMERSMEVMEETGMPQALPREVCWSVGITLTFFTRTLVMDPLLEVMVV